MVSLTPFQYPIPYPMSQTTTAQPEISNQVIRGISGNVRDGD